MAKINPLYADILRGRKVAYHTLGCKVNQYETEAMQQILEQYGCVTVPFDGEEPADVYLVNTCSVTNIADRKSRQMLRKAKKNAPESVMIATGCYAQIAGEELIKSGLCDILIGTNQKLELPGLLSGWYSSVEKSGDAAVTCQALSDISRPVAYEDLQIERVENTSRAFMKIQEGCNQFCSYCIIPYARGRIRSRSLESILTEARALAASGVREIVLTGIHLDSYGLDLPDHRQDLAEVVEELAKVEGVERIRLGSLEPRIITEAFAKRLAAVPEFCPYFHLSLQSGSDSVLKRMNRHYTTAEFAASCDLLRDVFDHPIITTDVITGFPQETEEEHAETRAFLSRIRFYELNVFPFSRRKGTRADRMEGQLTEAVKKERGADLIAIDRDISIEYRKEWIADGRPAKILVEEIVENEGRLYAIGHTERYIRCALPVGYSAGDVFEMETQIEAGEIVKVVPRDRIRIGRDELVLAERTEL